MGFDLVADLGTERLTFRRLLRVILPNLPPTSAFRRAIDPDGSRWGEAEHLLAVVIDLLNLGNWQRQNAGSKNPSEKPKPYPRPEQQAEIAEKQLSDRDLRIAALKAQGERARERQRSGGG